LSESLRPALRLVSMNCKNINPVKVGLNPIIILYFLSIKDSFDFLYTKGDLVIVNNLWVDFIKKNENVKPLIILINQK